MNSHPQPKMYSIRVMVYYEPVDSFQHNQEPYDYLGERGQKYQRLDRKVTLKLKIVWSGWEGGKNQATVVSILLS